MIKKAYDSGVMAALEDLGLVKESRAGFGRAAKALGIGAGVAGLGAGAGLAAADPALLYKLKERGLSGLEDLPEGVMNRVENPEDYLKYLLSMGGTVDRSAKEVQDFVESQGLKGPYLREGVFSSYRDYLKNMAEAAKK